MPAAQYQLPNRSIASPPLSAVLRAREEIGARRTGNRTWASPWDPSLGRHRRPQWHRSGTIHQDDAPGLVGPGTDRSWDGSMEGCTTWHTLVRCHQKDRLINVNSLMLEPAPRAAPANLLVCPVRTAATATSYLHSTKHVGRSTWSPVGTETDAPLCARTDRRICPATDQGTECHGGCEQVHLRRLERRCTMVHIASIPRVKRL